MALTPVHELLFDAAFPFLGGKFKDYFLSLGAWDLTAGDAQQGFLGSRFVNVLGVDYRLVFSPFGWLLGPGRRNPMTDLVMGLGDDVSFTYGGRISATYGGPVTNIVRGMRINKFGSARPDLAGFTDVQFGAPPVPKSPLDWWVDEEDEKRPARVYVAEKMKDTDKAAFVAVAALGTCLTLITNILEIIAHAKFGQYDKATGHATITADDGQPGEPIKTGDQVTIKTEVFNSSSDISSGFRTIREIHRWLPRRLMAIIYHIEIAGTFSGYMFHLWDGLQRIAKKIATILVYCVPPLGLFLYEYQADRLSESIRTVGFWLKLILAVIFLVVIILMFVAIL